MRKCVAFIILFSVYIHIKSKYILAPSTFLTLSQFVRFSLEMVIKNDMNSRVKLCQNKLILIMSDNFDRKVCNELG